MLFEKEIVFSFKGNRDYIHGTDIFDKILDTVGVLFKEYPNKMKGSFHQPLESNAILRIYDDAGELHLENLNALFSFQLKNSSYHACLTEVNSQITSSYEYDEKRVLDKMIIERETARMVAKSSYTYIEQMVAMTKKLHLTLYPDVAPKWLFTKIEIQDAILADGVLGSILTQHRVDHVPKGPAF